MNEPTPHQPDDKGEESAKVEPNVSGRPQPDATHGPGGSKPPKKHQPHHHEGDDNDDQGDDED